MMMMIAGFEYICYINKTKEYKIDGDIKYTKKKIIHAEGEKVDALLEPAVVGEIVVT